MKKVELMLPCPYQVDNLECMATLRVCDRIPLRCEGMLRKWIWFCRENGGKPESVLRARWRLLYYRIERKFRPDGTETFYLTQKEEPVW